MRELQLRAVVERQPAARLREQILKGSEQER
jgi:hypothetical protein